jgi:hypothetical protein
MDASIRRFWWKPKSESGRYLAWKAWADLCAPKIKGGLGFRCAKSFNEALLTKLTWLVISGHDSPCMNALRSKYKVNGGWINSEPQKLASPTWRAIERLKPIVRKGACFLIGDGLGVDCWKDPWVPGLQSFLPLPKDSSVNTNPLLVANLINFETNSWRYDLLDVLFDVESRVAIAKIVLPVIPRPDKLMWIADPKGVFSVKSVHKMDLNHAWPAVPDPTWQKLWKCKIHERLKTLIWRIGSGVLPTNLNVHSRLSKGNPCCPLCNAEDESIPHLFFNCQATKFFWFGACWGLRPDLLPVFNDFDVVKLVVNPPVIPSSSKFKESRCGARFYSNCAYFGGYLEFLQSTSPSKYSS